MASTGTVTGRDREAALEEEADRWVRKAGGATGEYPAYSEDYLRRRDVRRHVVYSPHSVCVQAIVGTPLPGLEAATLLRARSWGEMKSHLTRRQRLIVSLRRQGATLEVIAAHAGCSVKTVYNERERIREIIAEHPLWGLAEMLYALEAHEPAWTREILHWWQVSPQNGR